MLSCERFAKCRTTCGSESSGRAGGAAATAADGSNSLVLRSGTSHAGNRCARRPASESSNNNLVSRVLRMDRRSEFVYLCFRPLLSDGHQETVIEFWVPSPQRHAREKACLEGLGK